MLARLRELPGSDTGRAAGMAAAVMVSNVVALAFTVVFARVLGQAGYGSLAALLSTFIILMVPGSALQTTVAREVSAAVIGVDEHEWGAAGALPAGAIWLILSVERGALQAFQRYRLVGASVI